MAVAIVRAVNAKAVFFLNNTQYGLNSPKCIFNERLKEVLTIKLFHNASVQNFRQMKLRIAEN